MTGSLGIAGSPSLQLWRLPTSGRFGRHLRGRISIMDIKWSSLRPWAGVAGALSVITAGPWGHSPQCTSCNPGQSRNDTARSWSSAALGAEAMPASRGRRGHPAGSHRNCKGGTRRCHKQPSVGEVEVLSGVTMVVKTSLLCFFWCLIRQFKISRPGKGSFEAHSVSGLEPHPTPPPTNQDPLLASGSVTHPLHVRLQGLRVQAAPRQTR